VADDRPLTLDSLVIGEPEECWPITAVPGSGGYASRIHRFIASLFHGDISGLVVHHTCGNKLCGNPAHLRPLTDAEHHKLHMKEKCLNGHDLSNPANVRWYRGFRWCRPCDALRRRRYRAARS